MTIDQNSDTWRTVVKWANQRIASRTKTCTTPGMPIEQTEQARGALIDLDLLLDLGKEKEQRTIQAYAPDFGG